MDRSQVKVVIVGAGVSGLAAALTLIQGGIKDVTVLEAQPRTGGRVRTIYHGDHVLELGAQWIHGDEGNPIYELAASRGLVRKELTGNSAGAVEMKDGLFMTLSGKAIRKNLVQDVNDAVKAILAKASTWRTANQMPLYGDSLAKFWNAEFSALCRPEIDSPELRKIKIGLSKWHEGLICVQNACSSVSELALSGYGEYEVPGTNEFCELAEGYQRVLDTVFLPGLGGCIKTNVPVTHISLASKRTEPGSVVVQYDDGISKEIRAEHVIVTVPLGFLKRHSGALFSPPLPAHKAKAVENLQFGTVNKIYIVFEKAFWDASFSAINFVWLSDDQLPKHLASNAAFAGKGQERPWWRGLLGAYVVKKQPRVLEMWLSGNDAVAVEAVTEDEDVLFVCWKLLECFTGKPVPRPVRVIRTAWSSAAYTYGSYTSLAPESSALDIEKLAEPIERDGVPCILFAGEATCQKYFSTVHGAYISGVREAARLLSHYGSASQRVGKSVHPSKL